VDMILDGGPCHVGIESTVVDMTGEGVVILRPGAILLPLPSGEGRGEGLRSPGLMQKHYAPSKPVRLNATDIHAGEALLAFGHAIPQGATLVENLSANGDLHEAAANLFRMLRLLDAGAANSIAVMPIPEEGLGVAINDRLKRAAN
jgi:L-threonylcarbamoyladenylate synthase